MAKLDPRILDQQQTVKHFQTLCVMGTDLFEQKNAQYDSAFKKFGLLGVVFELLGILSRLPPMTIWSPDHGRSQKEKLTDLFTDLHNYANMALICIDENNWDGRKEIEG